jgi:hypothetical protein
MYIEVHVKGPLLLSKFNEILIYRQIEKYSSNKFREKSSSGSRVVACGRTDGHKEGNRPLRNFTKAPKK